MNPWNYELSHGESVDCVAVGSGWCAVATTQNYIRVFSTEGLQRHLICHGNPLVTMAGYENFLAVVYNSSPAFLSNRSMRVKIINMASREHKVLIDAECPVSPDSKLEWFGFSEEG